MTRRHVWDPLVRAFHWTLVTGFVANALFTDPESDLHRWVGYAILAILAIRLVWGFVGPRHARFRDFPPSPAGAMREIGQIATGRREAHLGHSPLGALMIYNLILSMTAIGVTGWMMTTNAYWGVEWVEATHEALVDWVWISAAFHLGAVLWESRRTGVNLPRAMVTGYKDLPEGLPVKE